MVGGARVPSGATSTVPECGFVPLVAILTKNPAPPLRCAQAVRADFFVGVALFACEGHVIVFGSGVGGVVICFCDLGVLLCALLLGFGSVSLVSGQIVGDVWSDVYVL